MKPLLLLAAIVGCVSLVNAQAPTSEHARMNAHISQMFTSGHLWANEIRRGTKATTFHLRGAVRIVQGDTTIVADEADVEISPDGAAQYDLKGNVHVTVEKTR